MKARGALAILVCAMAALALPASAAAKPGYYVITPSIFSSIDLRGNHGYGVHIFGLSRKQVWIVVEKGGASAAYLWRGRVTENAIEAKLGKFGRVSVQLRPGSRSEVEEGQADCKGRPGIRREGRFAGVIRFRGENGFTSVDVKGARGTTYRGFRLVCKRREVKEPEYERPPTTSLSAVSGRYPRAPWFSVFKQEPARRAAFPYLEEAQYTAHTTEPRPGLGVVRSASVTAEPETFAVSPPGTTPATATVAPPAPFSGTASYEKQPGGAVTWSGDLAVELPGRGTLSLTDSTFRAELCRSLACACPIGECFFISVAAVEVRAERLRRLAARVQP
ncbi:MAG TPA: hypothetical protein VFS54_07585 [Solirubrobacterales bacterium]|nr:hypothetical protein [Solirubrobacterales bacterium]